jgi:hypothetical protein
MSGRPSGEVEARPFHVWDPATKREHCAPVVRIVGEVKDLSDVNPAAVGREVGHCDHVIIFDH